jgi:hypothetical protein
MYFDFEEELPRSQRMESLLKVFKQPYQELIPGIIIIRIYYQTLEIICDDRLSTLRGNINYKRLHDKYC